MNILYHHRTQGKGAEGVHIGSMVKAFRKLGNQVFITGFPGVTVNIETENNVVSEKSTEVSKTSKLEQIIKMIARSTPELLFEAFEIVYNAYVFLNLSRIFIFGKKPDFIYERYSLFMFSGVLVARIFNIPIFIEINDSALVDRVRPLVLKRIAMYAEAYVVRHSSVNVFISEKFKELVAQAYTKISLSVVTPNAADLEKFDHRRYEKSEIKKELGLEGKVVCGYVGAFLPWHGIDTLVEKIAPMLKETNNLVMLLVGDGKVYQNIKQIRTQNELENQLIMVGRVAHHYIPKYLAAMDCAVLPDSNIYGSPMKIFEYMAMGVPVIVPDYEPIKEVIKDNDTGWIFPRKDFDECAKKIVSLSTDKSVLECVGMNSFNYIKEYRTWEKNADVILSQYRRL